METWLDPDHLVMAGLVAAIHVLPCCALERKTRMHVTSQHRHDTPSSIAYVRGVTQEEPMCRNIRTLFNFEPPASEEEIRASALQFVRKLSGFNAPSQANEAAFRRAVDEVSDAARRLLDSLATTRPPRNRETEAVKARARARERFA
jgi:hypothetical protein